MMTRLILDTGPIVAILNAGEIECRFNLGVEINAVCPLIVRYANVPMSLADACLVRMSELHTDRHILTLDADFNVYRRNGNRVIPTVMPSSR